MGLRSIEKRTAFLEGNYISSDIYLKQSVEHVDFLFAGNKKF